MNIKLDRKYKKYFKLIEELKSLCDGGYIDTDKYYPDMAEINESLYEYVLKSIGVFEGEPTQIACIYTIDDIDELESIVKEGRKYKKQDKVRYHFDGNYFREVL